MISKWNSARYAALAVFTLSAWACGSEGRLSLSAQQMAGGGDPEVVARRLLDLEKEEGTDVVPSPDGRFVAYTAWENDVGSLVLREWGGDRATEKVIRPGVPLNHPFVTRISPDGQWMSFMVALPEGRGYDLRSIRADGSREQLLLTMRPASQSDLLRPDRTPTETIEWADAQAWSPDGRSLLTVIWSQDKTTHLALISPEDGSRKILRAFDWRSPMGASFSPDGRLVAYDFPPDENRRGRDLYLVAVDGTREVRLTEDDAVKQVIGWSRDGTGLYYTVENSLGSAGAVRSIWRLPMRGERPAGSATLVRGDLANATAFVFEGEKLFYTTRSSTDADVWSVSIDLESGRVMEEPTRFTSVSSGALFWHVSWTSDGQYLTHVRRSRGNRTGLELVLQAAATGQERAIPLEIDAVRWHRPERDGSVLVSGSSRGRPRLLRVDVATGQAIPVEDTELMSAFGRWDVQPSPDGRIRYFIRRGSDATAVLVRRDVATGEERVLVSKVIAPVNNDLPESFRLSPDGSLIAYLVGDDANTRELWVIPSQGGVATRIHSLVSGRGSAPPLNWTSDGKMVVFRQGTNGLGPQHWKARADGTGSEMVLWICSEENRATGADCMAGPAPMTSPPQLHPNDRRIVYVDRRVPAPISELWVLENLPESRARTSTPR